MSKADEMELLVADFKAITEEISLHCLEIQEKANERAEIAVKLSELLTQRDMAHVTGLSQQRIYQIMKLAARLKAEQ